MTDPYIIWLLLTDELFSNAALCIPDFTQNRLISNRVIGDRLGGKPIILPY